MEYFKISRNMMVFQKKKIFNMGSGSRKKKKGEEERNPVVGFCFAASFDLDTNYIIQRISFKWGNMGGLVCKSRQYTLLSPPLQLCVLSCGQTQSTGL